MGLSSSKHNAPGPSPSSSSSSLSGAVVPRSRSTRSRVLKSSCLRSHRSDNDEPQHPDIFRTDKAEESNEMNCINSGIELNEWGESSFTNTVSREGTSRDFSSRSLNPPSRFLSRFSFYPGNLSFRLARASSLGSARSYPASSTRFTISNEEEEEEEEEEECAGPSSSSVNRNDRPQGCDFFPACFSNRSPRTRDEDCTSNSSPDLSDNFQDDRQLNSGHDVLRSRNDARVDCSPNLFSPINHINSDGAGIRHAERRFTAREPVERNVRFSRTLSVGRLRDRVLRRTPAADLDLYHFQQDRAVGLTRHVTGRQGLGHAETEATSDDNNFNQQVSSDNVQSNFSNPFYGSQSNVYETHVRETRYRDLLEHRSNFLERRRRIRSQVRALQRLGSRFENLSVHERSCMLSGQHRGGHCTCRSAAREANSNDDANARASISRIVMLAEALFEVLDEIHQQSVVLSSRPSVSSIGSIPAPNEVVDSLPLKIFSKSRKKTCDDASQCYICLVEYDDGDSMRILPCHHEFHRVY
ncbi:hypothetical protein Sango_2246600 [Sesamum angolense]|uniref:RING-type domain-containing protein n=1 Tax=Sesamum angolense TaxID=2727404 RepID=A0AAE1W980_9LAMI|nr:hypothetical protein Sango_2246600 [Sesamum angolense]